MTPVPQNFIRPASPVELSRRELGLRQIDLADAAGVSRQLVVLVEGGHVPRPEFREKLARVLGQSETTLWPEVAS